MNISIRNITLRNFKCFREASFQFDGLVSTFAGRNGSGKTTIADAILWCLFGKNSAGQSSFDLKTHDESGRTIPHLEHSVEMELCIVADAAGTEAGQRVLQLKRVLQETWVKKRGATDEALKGHTTEFYVDGEAYTAKDYEAFISGLIPESTFRAITNPQYFPSLKWQQQREFLSAMVGDIEPEAIADTDELKALVSKLAGSDEDIVSYRKHLSYRIKQVKEKLDKIPVRLEEQHKALPEAQDWASAETERESLLKQIAECELKAVAIKTGNGQDLRKAELRSKLDGLYAKKQAMSLSISEGYMQTINALNTRVNDLRQQFNQLVSAQRDLEAVIPSFDTLATRCRASAEEQFRTEQAYVRQHWPETQADFFGSGEAVCPVCGQQLPANMLADAEEQFNSRKADLKKQLTERATKAKQLISEAEETAKGYEQQKAEKEQALKDVKDKINEVFAEKQKAEKERGEQPGYEELLVADNDYQALLADIEVTKQEMDAVSVSSEDDMKALTEIGEQVTSLKAQAREREAVLATKVQYDRVQELIRGIETEEHDLMLQLSELEQQEDVACQYQDRQNVLLEERVNKHFHLVRWKMFRTVNNGGDPFQEPYCECYVDGSAYHDGLNQASRLNAGLDIINALCRYYAVSAPIVLDNSESTLNIIDTIGQQIRLQVADTDLALTTI